MTREPRLTVKAQRELEERFRLEAEAVRLLDIIAAEFKSDPTSVRCFDLRVVERSIEVTRRLRELRSLCL